MQEEWLNRLNTVSFLKLFLKKEIPETAEFERELFSFIRKILPEGGRILLAGSGAEWLGRILAQDPRFHLGVLCASPIHQQQLAKEGLFQQPHVRLFVEIPTDSWDMVCVPDGLIFLSEEEQTEALKALKPLASRYLAIGAPNSGNYWYWIWYIWTSLYSHEALPKAIQEKDLISALQRAGLESAIQVFLGQKLTHAYVHWLYGMQESLRQIIYQAHRSGLIPQEEGAAYRLIVAPVNESSLLPDAGKTWQTVSSQWADAGLISKNALADAIVLAARYQAQSAQQIQTLQEEVQYLTRKNQQLLDEMTRFRNSPAWLGYRLFEKVRQAILPSGGRAVRYLNRLGWVRKVRRFIFRNYYAELMDILHAHGDVKGVIVFPPSIEWKATLYQRPQHLALAFAREGYLVFYCQPEYVRSSPGYHEIAPRLYLTKVEMKYFKNISRPVVMFYPYNREYLPYFNEPYVIYDYIDELEVFSRPLPELQENHRFFLRNAQLVIATADSLLEQVREIRPDALLVPNGVDYGHFQQVWQKQEPPPHDLAPMVQSKRPIVGYYGALARWFDYDLLRQVAALRPDVNFVLIGPDYDGTIRQAHLDQVSNIFWLGKKDYQELPKYLRYFDACMIPFVVNDITHSTSPLKLFEYMAAHKPVVITPMRESMKTEGVLVADTPQKFSQMVDEALKLGGNPAYHQLADRVALHNTWQVRAQQMIARISPDATGPEFNFRLQMYLQEVGRDMSPETLNLWETFARSTIERGSRTASRLAPWMNFHEKSFLDVGCAYGGFLIAFAQRGCSRVAGIDVNSDLLRLAEINLKEKGVKGELHLLSVEAPEFLDLGTFDIVTCNDVIEHVPNPELTLQQIVRVLNPGGLLYMEILNPFWYGFLAKDGHYNLPGITLLTPKDAEAYFKALYPNTAYGVNEYHLIDWYIQRMNYLGLNVRLLNERWVEPAILLKEMELAIQKMNAGLNEVHIPVQLAEKIRRRARLLLRYVQRRAGDSNAYTHLCQTFGANFWIILAQKR
ncbi:methyltransferase domain-containing protein [Anaerolinea thermophila]|uniref:Methyltransferase type 11 domain-containing protein n=1 Tax=Anaerolinea thermophila (strain DSM 14523 / JCM 11388 / NBRC 100420 / UNI-1) TaxID=926569 RepID=E8N208_ANATU|nr:methyltransferase domain-containing protein [Anaerolinea thermophila]BAJ64955.1 hypothetical protein ANT_29290 [Anaerolinea thermophila UNI-1]